MGFVVPIIALVREPLAGRDDPEQLAALKDNDRVVFCLPSGERLACGLSYCLRKDLVPVVMHPLCDPSAVIDMAAVVQAAAVWDEHGIRLTGAAGSSFASLPGFITLSDPRSEVGAAVVIGQPALVAAASVFRSRFIAPGSVHFSCVPLYTTAGYLQLMAAAIAGCSFVTGIPACGVYRDAWRLIFEAGYAIPGVQTVAVDSEAVRAADRKTGEPPNVVLVGDCLDCPIPPWKVSIAWGPDEMSGMAFCSPSGTAVGFVDGGPVLGGPVPGVAYRVVDGRLQLKGRYAFQGYLDPARTAAATTFDGWIESGHRAEIGNNYLIVRPKVPS